jgi:hypothetical protein
MRARQRTRTVLLALAAFGGAVLGCGRYCGCAGCATRGAIGVGDAGCGGGGYRFCAGRLVAL